MQLSLQVQCQIQEEYLSIFTQFEEQYKRKYMYIFYSLHKHGSMQAEDCYLHNKHPIEISARMWMTETKIYGGSYP